MAQLAKKVTLGGSTWGAANCPESAALSLGISLADTTGALGVASATGRFEINGQTITLTGYDNPALGVGSTTRKVRLFGSCVITSTDITPAEEYA